MNKEETLNTFLLANIPEIITQEEFNDVKKAIRELQQENKKYKEVIDKAIELHNNFAKENAGLIFENDGFIKFMNNLLDILKEVSE